MADSRRYAIQGTLGLSTYLELTEGLLVEPFGELALVLIPEHERFVTVDRATEQVLWLLTEELGHRRFTPPDVASLLVAHYELSAAEAMPNAVRMLGEWLEHGLVVRLASPDQSAPDATSATGR